MEFFQSAINLISPNQTPKYRGVETRRQSSVDKSFRPPLNPSQSLVLDRGLVNKPGENNCFLNTAVQILWHNDVFRRSFRQFEKHTCDGEPCIFCALKVLFTQFQHSGQVSIPPDVLRVAMSNCYSNLHRFQLGLMDDAAECFEKILEQIHYNLTGSNDLDSCSAPWCISHQKFALTTVEQTVCTCGARSEPLPYVEFVHYITTSQLVNQSLQLKNQHQTNSFDVAVKRAGAIVEDLRCPNSKCKRNAWIRRSLLNAPDIRFIWDSDSPPLSFIMNVVEAIDTKIHPNKLFSRVTSDKMKDSEYQLTAMITYYGRHYSTYCYHTHKQHWVYFDDAKIRKAGSNWSNIVEECRKAHFQPLLLVYSNPQGTSVDATKAPTIVSSTSSSSKNSSKDNSSPTPSTVASSSPTSLQSSPTSTQPSSTGARPFYVNVCDQEYTTVGYSGSDDNSGEQPMYATVRHNRPLPSPAPGEQQYDDVIRKRPIMQKQDDIEDLIQFSITPASVLSATTTGTSMTTSTSSHGPPPDTGSHGPPPSTGSHGTTPSSSSHGPTPNAASHSHPSSRRIHDNPFMVQDVKTRPYPVPPKPLSGTSMGKPPVANPRSSSVEKSSNLAPIVAGPNSPTSLSTAALETNIRGLPKNIRDAILHSGLCLQKINQSQDIVVTSILLDSAISRIHSIVNHPSVTACPDLHQHLKFKKDLLQRKLSSFNSDLEKARSDPLSLHSVLSKEDINVARAPKQRALSGSMQECIECKNRRVCDERLLCGPCRLKLRLQTDTH